MRIRIALARGTASGIAACCLVHPLVVQAASLTYTVTLRDPAAGTADVAFLLEGFPYAETDLILAEPPHDPATYFLFFDQARFETTGGKELVPTRETPGIVHVTGIDGTLSGSYQIRLQELGTALGHDVRTPLLTPTRTVLPLRSILAVPSEVDTKGLELTQLTVAMELPEGWKLLSPHRAYGGRVSFAENGIGALRGAVFAAGEFELRNDLEGRTGSLRAYAGGTAAAVDSLDAAVTKLLDYYSSIFSTQGTDPVFLIVEFADDAPVEVMGRGASIRARCPASVTELGASGRRFGSASYELYHTLAHEIFHRWLGVSGMMVPLGPEIYWLSEGAGNYLATRALAKCGLAAPESALEYLSNAANTYRGMANRATSIDAPPAVYEADAAYRRLVITKGTLASFLLDIHLMRAQEESSLAIALRRMFYGAFLRDRKVGAFFSESELVNAVNAVLGLRGSLLINALVRADLYDQLLSRPGSVGLRATEGEAGGLSLSFATPEAFYRRSLLP